MFIPSLVLLSSIGISNAAAVLDKRDVGDETAVKFLPIPLEENGDFYSIPLNIGNSTNSTIFLKLDTTTNSIWVNSDTNEFCQAAYPLLPISNATDWNLLNEEWRMDYLNNLASFQSAQNSQLETLVNPSKTIDYQSAVTLFHERQSSLSGYIVQQKSSLTSEINDFASTKSAEWNSYASKMEEEGNSIKSEATKVGNAIVTKAESFGGEVTSFGDQLATKVTSFAATKLAGPVTELGESIATDVTSEFGDLTSGFGDFTEGAASRFGDLTSGIANFFKRDDPTSTSTIILSTTYPSVTEKLNFEPSETYLEDILPTDKTDFMYYEIADCSIYGTFNGSDTFVSNETIYISEDGEVVGLLGNDTFYLPSGPVENVTFAVAEISDSNIGSFGLGQKTENSTFTPFPEFLVENGLIEKALYSLELLDSNASVLFGAINFDAFYDNLTMVPLLNETEAIAITLSSFGLSYSNEEENAIYDIIIAEGSAFTILDSTVDQIYLPLDVLDALVSNLNNTYNVEYYEEFGRFIVTELVTDADVDNKNNTTANVELEDMNVSFHFQGLPIDIPLYEFLVPIIVNETDYFNYTTPLHDGKNESYYYLDDDMDEVEVTTSNSTEYILNILPSESDEVILGLSFLKEIYLVVDLESQVVGLAPINKDSSDDDEPLTIITISDDIPYSVNATYFDDYYGSSNVTSLVI